MFDSLSFRDARPLALLKRAVWVLPVGLLPHGAGVGLRGLLPGRSLELQLTEPTLRGGSVIQVAVAGPGRTTIDVRVELIQG